MREPPLIPVQRGDTVGRYVVQQVLGRGGLGTVARAYDPDLDRPVALKFVRPDGAGSRARVLFEARAMARLAHPNVVAVYDVVEHAGEIVIAMELGDGNDVDTWLREPRSLDQILDVFGDCARGLAAAHDVDICHRDCKPSNFLVMRSGSGKVADFGLARPSRANASISRRDQLDAAMAAGWVSGDATAGTPGYVAPEVGPNYVSDARSDQYAFFVSLLEALTRAGTKVPGRLRRIVRRGMSARPHRRYADMHLVAGALRSVRRQRRTRTLAIATAAVAAGGVAAVQTVTPTDPCAEISTRWSPMWNSGRRAMLVDGATTPAEQRAADTFAEAIDTYASGWTAGYASACEDDQNSSEARKFAAQSMCYEQRWQQARALIEVAFATDERRPDPIPDPTRILDPLLPCEQMRPSSRDAALERGTAHASKIWAAQLAEVRALRWSRRHQLARAAATDLVARSEVAGLPNAKASALLELGLVHQELGEFEPSLSKLRGAYWLADATGDDLLRARCATAIVGILGNELQQPDQAAPWATRARSAVQRIGPQSRLAAELSVELGTLASAHGDLERARLEYLDALPILKDDAAASAVVLQNLAVTEEQLGRLDEADGRYQEALELLLDEFGPEHPAVAMVLHNQGVLQRTRGNLETAMNLLERALLIKRAALPTAHRSTALTLYDLGTTQHSSGQIADARVSLAEAHRMLEEVVGPDHPLTGDVLAALTALAERPTEPLD